MRANSHMLKKTGNNIRICREKTGFLQRELAQSLGVDKSTLSRWESGDTDPGILGLTRLSQFFDISMDDLLYGDDPEPTIPTAPEEEIDEDALNAAREYDALRANNFDG